MSEEHPLRAAIDAELAKLDNNDVVKTETKPESSIKSSDEDSSELASPLELEEVGNDSQEVSTNQDEDPYLKEALEMGYNPNYKGSNRKSAEQFVRDGSFFKKIDELKKENKEVKDLLKQQFEHARKVEKATYEKTLNEIKQEKLNMVNEGDVEGYKIAEQKEQIVQKQIGDLAPLQPTVPEMTPEVAEFSERNKFWLNQNSAENKEMLEDAVLIDQTLAKRAAEQGITISPKEHLKMVEDRVKKLYPHRFENPNRSEPIAVATSTASQSTKSSLSSRLTEQQRQFIKAANKYGNTITEEEYAKQLKLTGNLRD